MSQEAEVGGCLRLTEPASKSPQQLITHAVAALFAPGTVVELRIMGKWAFGREGTLAAGYFNDFEKLAQCLGECENTSARKFKIEGCYLTLNPCKPALLARYFNRLERDPKRTTSDHEVLQRTHLLIDSDPVRPTGISASDSEKQLAANHSQQIKNFLTARGWPAPLEFDSGNGFHLIYGIDLPNDDSSCALVKAILEALAAKFDTPGVKVDKTVFNAARITKAYGSLTGKGDDAPAIGRPHRRSKLVYQPVELKVVSRELLAALAAEAPAQQSLSSTDNSDAIPPEKMEEQLALVGITHGQRMPYEGGWRWHLDECVFDSSHKRTSVIIGIREKGALYYKCSHNSCQGLGWQQFKDEVQRKTGKQLRFRGNGMPDNLVLMRLKNEPRAWAAYNAQLETFGNDALQAYEFVLNALLRCGVTDGQQAARLMQAAPLCPLHEAQLPAHIRASKT
jgi:hypothetical protein